VRRPTAGRCQLPPWFERDLPALRSAKTSRGVALVLLPVEGRLGLLPDVIGNDLAVFAAGCGRPSVGMREEELTHIHCGLDAQQESPRQRPALLEKAALGKGFAYPGVVIRDGMVFRMPAAALPGEEGILRPWGLRSRGRIRRRG